MLDIGWSEIAVIAVVALVVIGPKDLPRALATVGKYVRKARMLAREFQSNVDEMVRQAELDDLRKQVEQARSLNLASQIEKAVDPDGGMREALTVHDPVSPAPQPSAPATTPAPVAIDAGKAATAEAATQPKALPPATAPIPATPDPVPVTAADPTQATRG